MISSLVLKHSGAACLCNTRNTGAVDGRQVNLLGFYTDVLAYDQTANRQISSIRYADLLEKKEHSILILDGLFLAPDGVRIAQYMAVFIVVRETGGRSCQVVY